jgi:type II restriction enzyme
VLPLDLIARYQEDSESVHTTWFRDEGRLKAFRTIRRGIQVLADDLEARTFANDYRGSTLETVIEAIAEQKQIFAGAAHPFYWKPKLRIPDIYEDATNQVRYAALLKTALKSTGPEAIVAEILKLHSAPIKGLGPASGNLLYFLHPTHFPPFNTAILKGFNMLTGQKLKLGDWSAYLQMRDGMQHLVQTSQSRLSRDLGDIAGLCFEIGSARMVPSQLPDAAKEELLGRWEKETARRHKEVTADQTLDQEHGERQAELALVGAAWGYDVWIARNDHGRSYSGGRLGQLSLPTLPELGLAPEVKDTVALIDVLWLEHGTGTIVAAFEVEKSTSIYSGILRLYDLAMSLPACQDHLYLVAPEARAKEVMAQLARPSLATSGVPIPGYIPFGELSCNCTQLARFGGGLPTLKKLVRTPA